MLDGTPTFLLGDERFVAGPGDFVNVPKGVVHNFRNLSDEPLRMILTFTPAGIEKFFEETLERAYDLTQPLPGQPRRGRSALRRGGAPLRHGVLPRRVSASCHAMPAVRAAHGRHRLDPSSAVQGRAVLGEAGGDGAASGGRTHGEQLHRLLTCRWRYVRSVAATAIGARADGVPWRASQSAGTSTSTAELSASAVTPTRSRISPPVIASVAATMPES